MPKQVIIDPTAIGELDVSITHASGTNVPATVDGEAVTWPHSITAKTTFDLTTKDGVVISTTYNGTEVAGRNGQPIYGGPGNGTLSIVPGLEALERSAALADTYATLEQTPTVEELVFSTVLAQDTGITTSRSYPLLIAPFALEVVQASFVNWETSGAAASDTDYWTISLRKRAPAASTIVSKTTQATGGEAITQFEEWNFDALTFDETNRTFAKGDVLDIAFVETGTGPELRRVNITVRYEPV